MRRRATGLPTSLLGGRRRSHENDLAADHRAARSPTPREARPTESRRRAPTATATATATDFGGQSHLAPPHEFLQSQLRIGSPPRRSKPQLLRSASSRSPALSLRAT